MYVFAKLSKLKRSLENNKESAKMLLRDFAFIVSTQISNRIPCARGKSVP